MRTKLTWSFFTINPKHFWFPSVLTIIIVIRQVRVITIHNEESIKITHLEKTYFRNNSLVCYCFCSDDYRTFSHENTRCKLWLHLSCFIVLNMSLSNLTNHLQKDPLIFKFTVLRTPS